MANTAIVFPPVEAALDERLRTSLAEVERRLTTVVESSDGFVTTAAQHLIIAGGKRFRPALALLAAEFGDPLAPGVVPVAVVMELTHLATLYHDDVMDEAPTRRGAQSANARWNNSVAILTGDFLFARASDLMVDLGLEAVRIQSQTFARLVEGQLKETLPVPSGVDALKYYLDVLADKTGSLIATSARLGARLAGAPASVEATVTEFGEKIGIAFQLSDDVIDIASDGEDLGKEAGTDLREGVPTLPVLLARRSSDPSDARLLELLAVPQEDDALHAEALTLLRAHSAMDEARAVVREWADDARKVLSTLPDIPARQSLADLCDLVVTRTA
jgi:heptaprenyl diphosphate synthase